jgi:C1A family cysteine protease
MDIPQEVDLRSQFPDCYDQGQLGSCTANGTAGLIQHLMMKNNYKWQFTPSRLFIYYNSRAMEGTVNQDAGAVIADVITAINKFGVCPESEADGTTPAWLWTYDDNTNGIPIINPPKFQKKPPVQCYNDAILHRALVTSTVNLDRITLLNTLAQGNPVTFGFTVYPSFEDKNVMNSGVMLIPGDSEQSIGGHCTDVVGYALNRPMGTQGIKDWGLIRNSWGTGVYGDLKGHFWMPLDAVLCNAQMSSDAHQISSVGFQK